MTSGLHHITLITRKIQPNVDFYVGFLGLRLVKRTAGFEDAAQLHLFYGDAAATPGSLVTFLAWEDGSPGRVGHGAASEISLAIRPEAIGFWLTRALQFGIRAAGPTTEFGEPVLRLTDPDGIAVKLVGVADPGPGRPWTIRGIAEGDAILGLRGATILSAQPSETISFIERYTGFSGHGREGTTMRLKSEAGGIIDVRDAGGFWTAAPGTGTIDHIAVRAPDRSVVEDTSTALNAGAHGPISVHDRTYFYSLYVREPGGTLLEMATDAPGFSVDEPLESLGTQLFIPQHFRLDEADVRPVLPQFGLPGEPRTIYRDLPFVHRIHVPEIPDGSTLILLHGSAGTETSLMPFARKLAPGATLIGLRGRAHEEGVARFFRRFDDGTFDQKDIAAEAEALAAFIHQAIIAYDLDPTSMTFIGYSNGANLLGAVMLLQPNVVTRAILLRAMTVLDHPPASDLGDSRVLIIGGEDDPFLPETKALDQLLRSCGANVRFQQAPAGHELIELDNALSRSWLKEGEDAR